MPKLSVVMPCFNKAEYLIEMIQTVIDQTYKNWELIIVDDGSTTENIVKVREFISRDSRITFIQRNRLPKNGNTCRNIGMNMAKGEYLLLLDSDDLLSKDCFTNRVDFMDCHPDCEYATFPAGTFLDGSSEIIPRKMNKEDDIIEGILSINYPFTVWSNIYRKECLNDIQWDEGLYVYQDFDFMLQCALKKLKHAYANSEMDYYYRVFNNGNSVCSNFTNPQKIQSSKYLFKKTLRRLEICNNASHLKQCLLPFLIRHFERLANGAESEDVHAFLNIIKPFYDQKIVEPLFKIYLSTERIKKESFRKAYLEFSLYKHYHIPIYKTQFIRSIGKILLCK